MVAQGFELLEPDIRRDPHVFYARARRATPVQREREAHIHALVESLMDEALAEGRADYLFTCGLSLHSGSIGGGMMCRRYDLIVARA